MVVGMQRGSDFEINFILWSDCRVAYARTLFSGPVPRFRH